MGSNTYNVVSVTLDNFLNMDSDGYASETGKNLFIFTRSTSLCEPREKVEKGIFEISVSREKKRELNVYSPR